MNVDTDMTGLYITNQGEGPVPDQGSPRSMPELERLNPQRDVLRTPLPSVRTINYCPGTRTFSEIHQLRDNQVEACH